VTKNVDLQDDSPTDRDMRVLARLVYDHSGIMLHGGKRALVAARLQKRLRHGGFRTFADYVQFVENDSSGHEIVALLDAIATNHTAFYREAAHFDYLATQVVPATQAEGHRGLQLWCAACSSGEEPYTMAMTLADALPPARLSGVRILASDISTKALCTAKEGVYRMDRVAGLPSDVLRRHFEKGLGEQAGLARVHPRLRAIVEFQRLNLLGIGDLGRRFDAIFCRNVMIYFDRAVQQRVVNMLEQHLAPNGWLFLSHSESLTSIKHGLHWVGPAIYRRRDS
jgi:chemotaxis protein methyltransferase CheR